MQSGFGAGGGGGSRGSGVSEMQQFMVEGGCPSSSSNSIFSMSTSNTNLHPHHQHHHHHHHPHHHPHHHHPQQQPLQPPPHFSHFQSIPITQQLFHQAHPFQLFSHPHHPELGLDLESGQENSNSGAVQPGSGGAPPPSFLTAAMSFKLGVNDNSSREDDGILHAADDASDSHVHPWQREEESTIKEPFWRPLDIDYINNKRNSTNEKQQQQQQQQHLQESSSKYYKKTNKEVNEQQGNNNGSNYKLFSELEAIYKPGNNNVLGGDAAGGGGGGSSSANNQTGSGSALTGDENPLMTLVAPGPISEQRISTINQISDTSTGEEAAPMKKHIKSGRRKRKRRQQQLSSLTAFFENMVKQLMDHQEGLHRKFLEVIEKRDQDRMVREETWRKEEAAKNCRETASRAQERALASSREGAIISFLEKITGETLNLPTKSQFQSPKSYHHSQNDQDNNAEHVYDPLDLSQEFMTSNNNNNNNNNVDVNNNQIHMNSSRWPKAEVHALIRVRSSLEMRFQEPGLKGPLWEEVSSIMTSMGYCRSSKRCKEKWENINKYFRKTKENGKKRPLHSKTCPYFHQLDQLYSKSLNNNNNNKLPPPPPTQTGDRKDNSELLDAIVLNNGHEGGDDHHHHNQHDHEENDQDKEEEDDDDDEEEEEEDGVKHQHHEHLFESLDS